jgi:hypothetical protein
VSPLGLLFAVLTVCFGAGAYAAARAGQWVIAAAAALLAAWFAQSAYRLLFRRR